MKLFEKIIDNHPSLFTEQDVAEITAMLADKPDNKYLLAAVMTPYIEDDPDKSREARLNYLAFMDEVEHKDGPFARKEGETPSDRLSWIYQFLHAKHPLYTMLVNGENAVRTRKGIEIVEDNPISDVAVYTDEQMGAFDEIQDGDEPSEGFWWYN